MKYRVTGGTDGVSGLNVGARRYEPGDVVDIPQSKAGWLVERGLLVQDSKKASTTDDLVDDEPVDEPADDDTTDVVVEGDDL